MKWQVCRSRYFMYRSLHRVKRQRRRHKHLHHTVLCSITHTSMYVRIYHGSSMYIHVGVHLRLDTYVFQSSDVRLRVLDLHWTEGVSPSQSAPAANHSCLSLCRTQDTHTLTHICGSVTGICRLDIKRRIT